MNEDDLEKTLTEEQWELVRFLHFKTDRSYQRCYEAARLCAWDQSDAWDHLHDPEDPGVIARLLTRIEKLESK